MTFEDALAGLARADGHCPSAELRWFEDNWAACGGDLVDRCVRALDGDESLPDNAVFFALHLAAGHDASAIHAPLCAFLLHGEAADALLGDALSETLANVLIATFDGDRAPMQAVIESASSDGRAAEAALLAIAYLTWRGRIERGATIGYLRHLFTTIPREPDAMWVGFADVVAGLGLRELAPLVETLFKEESIPREVTRLRHFREDFDDALAHPEDPRVFETLNLAPFRDPVGVFASWAVAGAGAMRRQGTVVNPMKEIGRNDPCPCGSGRKYKKCCLAA